MENINHDLKELYNIDDFTRNYDNDIRDVELILLSEYPDSACECTGKSIKQAVLENKSLNGFVIRDKKTQSRYRIQLSNASNEIGYNVYKLIKIIK